jgi:hypothetical protein
LTTSEELKWDPKKKRLKSHRIKPKKEAAKMSKNKGGEDVEDVTVKSLDEKISKLILEVADLKVWVTRMVRKGRAF